MIAPATKKNRPPQNVFEKKRSLLLFGIAWRKIGASFSLALHAKEKEPPFIKGGGYVIECLEAALWAFHNSQSFESGCLLAVNLGDDADTTGAVYGQLAGAYYGASGIPRTWVNALAKKGLLESHSQALHQLSMSFD